MISDLQKIGKVLKYLPHFRLFTKIYVINKILHYLKKNLENEILATFHHAYFLKNFEKDSKNF